MLKRVASGWFAFFFEHSRCSTEEVSLGTIRRALALRPLASESVWLLWGLVCCLVYLGTAALTIAFSFTSTVLVYPALYPWCPFQLWNASSLISFTIYSPCLGSPVLRTGKISPKLARKLHYRIVKDTCLYYFWVHLMQAWVSKGKPELWLWSSLASCCCFGKRV